MTSPEASIPGGTLADAGLAAFVTAAREDTGPSARELGAAELRRGARERSRTAVRGPEVGLVADLVVGGGAGVAVRRYEPVRRYQPVSDAASESVSEAASESGPGDSPLPGNAPERAAAVVVFLHGGFWTIGDLDSHDRACRRLVHATGLTVVAVDYRRAPEHPWPAAVDDAVEVVRWAHASAGGRPVAVMGDSAGGNLATLACLRLRDEGGPLPALQVLVYPNTDLTLSQPSVRSKGTGWGLTADAVAWGAEQWVPDPARRGDGSVSPLFADVHGLPPAVVVTAEHDPLRDEGNAYAARLAAAGVPVRHRCEPGQVHGFLTLDTVSGSAVTAGERIFADLVELL